MKFCPQCNRQYTEAWLTFCTQDGSLLREELSPPADPNSDPRIREPKREPTFDEPLSEQPTQWLPRDPPPGGGWIAPDERTPATLHWEAPPPSLQPSVKTSPPGLAIASFMIGLFGFVIGFICGVPIPGVIALILGIVALQQMKTAPHPAGRGLAIGGIVLGGVSVLFFVVGILWFLLSLLFG